MKLKFRCSGGLVFSGTDSTYKELKQAPKAGRKWVLTSTDSTYKELKLDVLFSSVHRPFRTDSTYKELKLLPSKYGGSVVSVPILPIRN